MNPGENIGKTWQVRKEMCTQLTLSVGEVNAVCCMKSNQTRSQMHGRTVMFMDLMLLQFTVHYLDDRVLVIIISCIVVSGQWEILTELSNRESVRKARVVWESKIR